MDLWIMIKEGKIETRIFAKSEPIYIGPSSCHDPKVFKSIFTGVGLRIRLNCSQDEDFDIAVEKFSRALAVSGFEKAKSELMKSKNIDREAYLKEEKNRKLKQKNKNNGKVFWISRYDPRIPHPRDLLSENYKILEEDQTVQKHKNKAQNTGRDKSNLSVTLLDYIGVTEEEVHGGVGCICSLCKKMKNLEDNWIMKLGCFS